MAEITSIADQFFADAERDQRELTEKNLRAWLWFTCPAHLRAEVELSIRRDARWVKPLCTCRLCGYEWEARAAEPKQCPRCKRYDWKETEQ